MADFKEKYREILDLLHDAQDEIKDLHRQARSKYSGLGQHTVVIKGGVEDQDQVLMDQGSDDADDDDDSTANLHSFDTNFSGNFKQQTRQYRRNIELFTMLEVFFFCQNINLMVGTLYNISPHHITFNILFIKLHCTLHAPNCRPVVQIFQPSLPPLLLVYVFTISYCGMRALIISGWENVW